MTSVIIVHPLLPPQSGQNEVVRTIDNILAEAAGLAEAINLDVQDIETAKIGRISPATLIGKGACDRIKSLIDQKEPDLVIVNHTLSPVQQRNLEKEWDCKVIDRTGLILEIFGARAQTSEGKIQVELAALNYQRSRLVRSWTHLERQRGGAGFLGGPGESQLELDRRLIDEKIVRLKRELEDVRRTRGLQRDKRKKTPVPVVSLVGYTNAGKSTLFNRLTGANVFAKDLLFATLDPTARKIDLGSGFSIVLADTVGFISDLPTHLIEAFRATLEQVQDADIILHVRDASSPDTEAQRADVLAILEDLGIASDDKRIIEVLNKSDCCDENLKESLLRYCSVNPHTVLVSAQNGDGCETLLRMVEDRARPERKTLKIKIPVSDGKSIAWLHAHGDVLESVVNKANTHLNILVRLDQENIARMKELLRTAK